MPCAVSKQLSCCGIKTTWTIGWCKSKLDPIVPDLKRQKSGNVTLPVFAADLSVFTPVCYFLWHLSRFLPSLLSLPPHLSLFLPSSPPSPLLFFSLLSFPCLTHYRGTDIRLFGRASQRGLNFRTHPSSSPSSAS